MVLAENTAILSFYKIEYKSLCASPTKEDESITDDHDRPPSESANVSVPYINPHSAKTAEQ